MKLSIESGEIAIRLGWLDYSLEMGKIIRPHDLMGAHTTHFNTGHMGSINNEVLETIPRRISGVAEDLLIVFFNTGRLLNNAELEQELKLRSLVIDPFAQLIINALSPEFSEIFPNGAEWNRDGRVASYFLFFSDRGWRKVQCTRSSFDFGPNWWRAGVRQ